MLGRITSLFPIWAIAICVLAWQLPAWLNAWGGAIVPLLSLVMFLMGLGLSARDFRQVFTRPKAIVIGVALQFTIMPLAAFSIARVMQLPAELAAGLIIVGCCAGGTASNVICYLARGNVALSISLTLCSTLLGVVLTPLLCGLYIGQEVEVDRLAMFFSIIQMVLVPVLGGVLIHHFWQQQVQKMASLLPLLAMLTIILIIGIIVALNQPRLADIGLLVLLAVVAHNTLGMLGGYAVSRGLRLAEVDCRTIAIEVGMQNSGLGVALAMQYFSALAALPGAVFSVWHNIAGSLIAGYWSRHPVQAAEVNP